MAPLLPNQFHVLALFAETAFWGMQLVTFTLTIQALLFSGQGLKSSSEINKLLLTVSILMLIFGTGDMSLNLLRMVNITSATGKDDEAFGSVAQVFRYITLHFQTLIGDGMLVYRAWIIYNRSIFLLLLTGALWLAAAGTTFALIVFVGTLPGEITKAPASFDHAMMTFWCTSIGLNLITTGLIVLQIHRSTKKHYATSTALQRSIKIVIESGAIYTIIAVLTLATFASNSDGVYITSSIEPQVVGIAFNLIIIRVSHHKDREFYGSHATQSHGRTGPGTISAVSHTRSVGGGPGGGMPGVTITKEFTYTHDHGENLDREFEMKPVPIGKAF